MYVYKDKPLWVNLLLCQFSRTTVVDYSLGTMTCLVTDSWFQYWYWSWFLSCRAVSPQIQFIVLITFVSLLHQWVYVARLCWFQSGFTTGRGKWSMKIQELNSAQSNFTEIGAGPRLLESGQDHFILAIFKYCIIFLKSIQITIDSGSSAQKFKTGSHWDSLQNISGLFCKNGYCWYSESVPKIWV